MAEMNASKITVETSVKLPAKTAWKYWTGPDHIMKWNNASEDWHTPSAENDLRVGGKFLARMEAKDGSFGFDFAGTYDEVIPYKVIAYTLDDDRTVRITFSEQDSVTRIVEIFDAENENPLEIQREGWQAILDNFKRYAEGQFRSMQ